MSEQPFGDWVRGSEGRALLLKNPPIPHNEKYMMGMDVANPNSRDQNAIVLTRWVDGVMEVIPPRPGINFDEVVKDLNKHFNLQTSHGQE